MIGANSSIILHLVVSGESRTDSQQSKEGLIVELCRRQTGKSNRLIVYLTSGIVMYQLLRLTTCSDCKNVPSTSQSNTYTSIFDE